MYSLITPKIAENFSSPAAMRSSTTDLNSFSCSANAELRTIIALAQFASEDFRNLRDIQFHPLFPSYGLQVFRFAFTDVLQHGRELRTEEAGYDGRRSLIGAEPVSIAGTYDRRFQKPVVAVDRHQGIDDECDESEIVGKILARRHQCESCVRVPRDQLLCLPLPFTPLKGFSCRRTRNPWFLAILRIRDMISMLWSLARLHSS